MILELSNITNLRGSEDGMVRTPEVTPSTRAWSRCPFFDLRVARQFLFSEGDTDKPLRPENMRRSWCRRLADDEVIDEIQFNLLLL